MLFYDISLRADVSKIKRWLLGDICLVDQSGNGATRGQALVHLSRMTGRKHCRHLDPIEWVRCKFRRQSIAETKLSKLLFEVDIKSGNVHGEDRFFFVLSYIDPFNQ